MKKKMVFLKDRLINEGYFDTEKEATSWAMMKRILVDNEMVFSINTKVSEDSVIRIKEYYKRRYVNKGGLKLEKALAEFKIDVTDLVCLDCGASMGGFTDCLLQHGAKYCYAVDVGHGQLAAKLIIDERVENLERTNISDEKLLHLSPTPQLVTLDLSYLSLRKGIPTAMSIMKNEGTIIALIKPIYEVYNTEIRRTGNVNEPEIHKEILSNLLSFINETNIKIIGLTNSPIKGNNDAIEYLIGLSTVGDHKDRNEGGIEDMVDIDRAIEDAFKLEKFSKNEHPKP